MGKTAIFDIEGNGFLDDITKIHSLVILDFTEQKVHSYHDGPKDDRAPWEGTIDEGIKKLYEFDTLVAHNGIAYDLPAIKKLKKQLYSKSLEKRIFDTLVISRLIWPHVNEIYPGTMGHSLEAWGKRLGNLKDNYAGTFESWNREMQDYCEQDTKVTAQLYAEIIAQGFDQRAILLEHKVAKVIVKQEQHGFKFDNYKAEKLYGQLCGMRHKLVSELKEIFPPIYVSKGLFTPKRDNKTRGYVEGVGFTKVEVQEFNPLSRIQIIKRFKDKYDWTPKMYTAKNQPKMDETILESLDFPEAKKLLPLFIINKRIGQLAEGSAAWMKMVKKDGRMHGKINTNGAVTGRMTHFSPNMAQVPANDKPYGKRCRELFTVPAGKRLVGIDATALENRCLAGYCYKYDQGDLVRKVTDSNIDIHDLNAEALNCDRTKAKTFLYALMYGAGDQKLSKILGKDATRARQDLEKSMPALGRLTDDVRLAARDRGYLKGLDGRRLHVRGEHQALNTLLQSAGALLMKEALCILYDKLTRFMGPHGDKWAFVANVHDEWQIEVVKDLSDYVGRLGVDAIAEAGRQLKFPCPLTGAYKVGYNWQETH